MGGPSSIELATHASELGCECSPPVGMPLVISQEEGDCAVGRLAVGLQREVHTTRNDAR